MTRDGFKIIDSDLHVLEPADLWERYIDPAFRDRAPRGLTEIRRGLGVVVEGATYGHAAEGIGRVRRDYSSGLQHEHYAEVEQRNYDGVGMLGAMDREGLDLAVLYPSRGLLIASVPGLDPELFAAISFHTTGAPNVRPGQAGGMFTTWMQLHTFTHAVPCMEGAAAFTAGGVLEEFPNLKVAFLEANCSWAPWLLWRLDEHYELGGHIERPQLKMKPSEYFRRQCYVSIEADEDSAQGIEAFGLDDNIVFSTDFPHPDSKWPFAVESVLKLPLGEDLKRKFLWENSQTFYSLS